MKKNKNWLKEQINYFKEAVGKPAINDFSRGLNDAYDTLESLIDQLDEPEITEEQTLNKPIKRDDVLKRMEEIGEHNRNEWIEVILRVFGNDYGTAKYREGYEQGVLNGIMESKKKESVVIPQFVADRIKEYKDIQFGISLIFMINRQIDEDVEFSKWLSSDKDNCELVCRSFLDGYTIEKETMYKVLLPGVESLDRQMCMHEETKVIGFADDGYNSRKYSKDDEFIRLFTEQEIKAIDERYWAFAEEVAK